VFELVAECNNELKDCGVPYAFCGGWALELFMHKMTRRHGDVDVVVFGEDGRTIVEFMINRGWNIYEHRLDWIDDSKANSYLRRTTAEDGNLPSLSGVWALKPGCSLVNIKSRPDSRDIYDYEILCDEQQKFDFMEIVFCKRKNGFYVCDEKKDIKRELEKAILHNNGIPYLAPEIILFFISDPAYQKSDYHREKSQSDYMNAAPILSKGQKDWLVSALETMYPDCNLRLEQLKML